MLRAVDLALERQRLHRIERGRMLQTEAGPVEVSYLFEERNRVGFEPECAVGEAQCGLQSGPDCRLGGQIQDLLPTLDPRRIDGAS